MHQQGPTPFISAVQIISITKHFDKLFCVKSLSGQLGASLHPRISEKFLEKIKSTCQKTIYIIAKNRDGYDELSSTIKELYELGDIDLSNDAVVSNARQFSSVSLALDGAYEAKDALLFGQTPDIVLFALEKALSSLDMIDARTTGEEIVNAIFSRFCVGK